MPDSKWSLKRPLAEFIAIFAGVTLSLFADDWRQARNDGRDEVTALELIHADLVQDSTVRDSISSLIQAEYRRTRSWINRSRSSVRPS